MPAVYVDTSALVKRYVGEVGTRWVRLALARPVRQRIYTALLAHTEVLSALQRKIREGTLAVAEAQRLARRVQPPLCSPVPPGGDHASARDPGQCPRAGPSLAGV